MTPRGWLAPTSLVLSVVVVTLLTGVCQGLFLDPMVLGEWKGIEHDTEVQWTWSFKKGGSFLVNSPDMGAIKGTFGTHMGKPSYLTVFFESGPFDGKELHIHYHIRDNYLVLICPSSLLVPDSAKEGAGAASSEPDQVTDENDPSLNVRIWYLERVSPGPPSDVLASIQQSRAAGSRRAELPRKVGGRVPTANADSSPVRLAPSGVAPKRRGSQQRLRAAQANAESRVVTQQNKRPDPNAPPSNLESFQRRHSDASTQPVTNEMHKRVTEQRRALAKKEQ